MSSNAEREPRTQLSVVLKSLVKTHETVTHAIDKHIGAGYNCIGLCGRVDHRYLIRYILDPVTEEVNRVPQFSDDPNQVTCVTCKGNSRWVFWVATRIKV